MNWGCSPRRSSTTSRSQSAQRLTGGRREQTPGRDYWRRPRLRPGTRPEVPRRPTAPGLQRRALCVLRRKPPTVRLRPPGRHRQHRFAVRLPGHRGRRHGLAGYRAWCSSIGGRGIEGTSGRPSGSAPGSPTRPSRKDHSADSGSESAGTNAAIPNVSTEHNIDCISFFGQLYRATGERSWLAASRRALGFVQKMWSSGGGFFYTGSNDGDTINPYPLPLDPQTWSWLALRDRRYARALEWASDTLAVTDDASEPNSQVPAGVTISGVTFSTASLTSTASYNGIRVNQQGVWLEGTAQLATLPGRPRRSPGPSPRGRTAPADSNCSTPAGVWHHARDAATRRRRSAAGRRWRRRGIELDRHRIRLWLFPGPARRRDQLVPDGRRPSQSVAVRGLGVTTVADVTCPGGPSE